MGTQFSNSEKAPKFEENDPPPLSEGWLYGPVLSTLASSTQRTTIVNNRFRASHFVYNSWPCIPAARRQSCSLLVLRSDA